VVWGPQCLSRAPAPPSAPKEDGSKADRSWVGRWGDPDGRSDTDPGGVGEGAASRYLQAQIDAINAQRQAYLDDLQRQSQLEEARGAALADALRGLNIPGQIQGLYGNASADIGRLAQAFLRHAP
jgi:hypothetical protein